MVMSPTDIICTIIHISLRNRRVMGIVLAVERAIAGMRRSSLIIRIIATQRRQERIRIRCWIRCIEG